MAPHRNKKIQQKFMRYIQDGELNAGTDHDVPEYLVERGFHLLSERISTFFPSLHKVRDYTVGSITRIYPSEAEFINIIDDLFKQIGYQMILEDFTRLYTRGLQKIIEDYIIEDYTRLFPFLYICRSQQRLVAKYCTLTGCQPHLNLILNKDGAEPL